MSRNARTLSLLSVVLLVGSLVALVSVAPLVRANTATNFYYVDNTGDANLASNLNACENDSTVDCSLRQAIEQANAKGGGKTIKFSQLLNTDPNYNNGFWTISPNSQLPAVTQNGIHIVGESSNNFPLIIIDGSVIATGGGSAAGLIIDGASGGSIENIAVVSFPGTSLLTGIGILITNTASNNEILGCYLGVNPNTLLAAGNIRAGIQIDNSAFQNRIGLKASDTSIVSNIIAGNSTTGSHADGIYLQASRETLIIGNYIGVIKNGASSSALANTGNGIHIVGSAGNAIGGATSASRNVISSNSLAGIRIEGSGSTGNSIYANLIGVNKLGLSASGNGSDGVQVLSGAKNTRLAGFRSSVDGALTPLVISGNTGYGVLISDSGTTGTNISQSYIGLSINGSTKVSNTLDGVRVQKEASSTTIGFPIGTTSQGENVISGNTGYGISIDRVSNFLGPSTSTLIQNNVIGLDRDGVIAYANDAGGLFIGPGAQGTIVGGLAAGEGNIISGNGPSGGASSPTGVIVNATAVVSTTISGNVIGLRRATLSGPYIAAAGNQGGGISVASGAQQVQIGGTLDRANTIAFNQGNGVVVGSSAVAVQINANSVTTNTLGGIIVTGVTTPTLSDNTVRANTAGPGIQLTNTNRATITNNTIATNGQNGLQVSASDAPTIRANTVTTSTLNGISVDTSSTRVTLDQNMATGNGQSGMSIVGSNTLTVTANTLSRNTGGSGLIVTGPASSGKVTDNTIESNGANGLTIVAPSATKNLTITGNLFQKNTGSGLIVTGNATNLLIQSNYVISNTINGIQLGDGGAGTHPQRVKIFGNTISRNGFTSGAGFPIIDPLLQHYGIVLNPATTGTPGILTNPNHDIDPPIPSSLVVSQDQGGTLYGRVLAGSSNAACGSNPATDCTIQLFNTDPTSRDGQGSEQISPPITMTSNGYFTSTLGFVPKQLALTATDKTGNTSEFAVFNADPKISALTPQTFNAKPGDVITITRQLINTGNIAFTNLHLTVTSNRSRWALTPEPSSLFSLAPGQSRTISVTLRLPTGSDSQVQAGSSGLITTTVDSSSTGVDAVQVTVADTINILPRVVLSVSAGQNGSGLPGTVLPYIHTITNNGNITTTVSFVAATTDNGVPAPTWVTIPPTSLTLAPGQSADAIVRVTVSPGSQDGKAVQTTLTATPSVGGTPDMTQVKSVVDTTTTTLQQVASMVPDRQTDAGATETVRFRHIVTNNSNGTATFKLAASSSQGSVITFTSLTSGVPLVNGNTFSLPNTPGSNTFDFYVNVTVDRRLLPGQKDVVTVILTDAGGGVIGGASVQDTINVTRGVLYPRLWLPVVVKP